MMNNNEILKEYNDQVKEILQKKLPNYTKKQIVEDIERTLIMTPKGLIETFWIGFKIICQVKIKMKNGKIEVYWMVK